MQSHYPDPNGLAMKAICLLKKSAPPRNYARENAETLRYWASQKGGKDRVDYLIGSGQVDEESARLYWRKYGF